jgi:hypothetical protein
MPHVRPNSNVVQKHDSVADTSISGDIGSYLSLRLAFSMAGESSFARFTQSSAIHLPRRVGRRLWPGTWGEGPRMELPWTGEAKKEIAVPVD